MPLRPRMELREYGKIFLRRKWMIVFTMLSVMFTASIYCVVTPELYKSSITILVLPQAVPQDYVRSTVGFQVEQQLGTIKQQVTSRTMLTKVMDELALFEKERKKRTAEEIIASMRKRIEIDVVQGQGKESSQAFSLSFLYEDPKAAMDGAARLASLFMEENLKTRKDQAVDTSEFLDSQLRDTKTRLEVMEKRIKEYKNRYMGELPQQTESNLRMLAGLQERLRNNETGTRALEERKVFLEAQIGLIQNLPPVAPAGNGKSAPALSPVQSLMAELASKKSKLAELNEKYTDIFPEVVRTKKEVADLERRIAGAQRSAALEAEKANEDPHTAAASPAGSEEIRRMKSQMKTNVAEIATLKIEGEEIQKRIASVERKIDQAPRREQEMISLIRDYENQKKAYDDLVKNKLEADVSQNLEKRQKGTQFQVLDPANLPEEPFQPNRKKVMGVFFLLALGLGFGGTIAWEAMDLRLRDVRTFRQIYKVPILGYIPVFDDQQRERELAVRRAAVFGGLITFTMVFSVFLLVFRAKIRAILNF